MFSSSVIKGDDLKRIDVAKVNYDSLATLTGSEQATQASEGFAPLTFSDASVSGDSSHAYGKKPPEEPVGEQVTLAEGMLVISKDELQQRLDDQYKNALVEGRAQAERGLANVFKALRQGVADLDGLRERVLRESEGDLLKLAIMIARKVIQQEVAQNPQILASIIAATIDDCAELERITIRLNPADYAVVTADRQGFFGKLCPDTNVSLAPDDTVGQGGCIVDTTTGTIDARIETQLDEIFRRFMEESTITATDRDGSEASQNVD